MYLVFGKNDCELCIEKLAELKISRKKYKYYDLDTAEGMAKAASLDLFSKVRDLPILVEDGKILE